LLGSVVNLITLLIMSFEDIKLRCLLYVHKGGNAVEIKTEADSNDMTECSHDDKPTTGVFHFPDSIFSALVYLLLCLHCNLAAVLYNWIASS